MYFLNTNQKPRFKVQSPLLTLRNVDLLVSKDD
jgi:hypothetical protein